MTNAVQRLYGLFYSQLLLKKLCWKSTGNREIEYNKQNDANWIIDESQRMPLIFRLE